MKKSTFGLIATAAILFTPVAAFAQDSQQNLQINQSGAAAIGEGNYVEQTVDQYSEQSQYGVNDYVPSNQSSIQDNLSEASAVGEYNVIEQDTTQESYQNHEGYNIPQY